MKDDLMERLAAARPASLDQSPDDRRRAIDLAEAMAHTPAGRDHRAALRTARRATIGLGLAGAVGAAAVVVTLGHGSTPQEASGSGVLLAAARRAETVPAGNGAYWRTSGFDFDILQVGKHGHPAYQVYTRGRSETWMPADGHRPSWTKGRDLGARPATAADRAAWRREGSPKAFRMREDGSAVSSEPGRTQVEKVRPGHYGDAFGQRLSPAEVRALPTDPAGLKAALTRHIKLRYGADQGGDAELFEWGTSVLLNYPATPKQRAGIYRMLAGLSGVTRIGSVTDPAGRTGTAVAMDDGVDDQGSQFQDRIVIDPGSARALAMETVVTTVGPDAPSTAKPNQLLTADVILTSGWTDDKPPTEH